MHLCSVFHVSVLVVILAEGEGTGNAFLLNMSVLELSSQKCVLSMKLVDDNSVFRISGSWASGCRVRANASNLATINIRRAFHNKNEVVAC